MRQVPIEKISEYAAEDADITLKLKNVFEKELKKEGLEPLFYSIEMPLIRVLAEMEITGVRVDTEALRQSSNVLKSMKKPKKQKPDNILRPKKFWKNSVPNILL